MDFEHGDSLDLLNLKTLWIQLRKRVHELELELALRGTSDSSLVQELNDLNSQMHEICRLIQRSNQDANP